MNQVIDATKLVNTPHDIINIQWEVDGSSGSTKCEAWRGQHEIDSLVRAGYIVTSITRS